MTLKKLVAAGLCLVIGVQVLAMLSPDRRFVLVIVGAAVFFGAADDVAASTAAAHRHPLAELVDVLHEPVCAFAGPRRDRTASGAAEPASLHAAAPAAGV